MNTPPSDPKKELQGSAALWLLVVGVPGLEDLLIEEIEEHGYTAEPAHAPGLVRARVSSPRDVVYLNLHLRQAYRVLILLCEDTLALPDLDSAHAAAEKVNFPDFMTSSQSFAVRGQRTGLHDFNSQELAAAVGTAIVDRLQRATGTRVRANLREPDVIFHAMLLNDRLWIGLDTTGDNDLSARHPRPFHHFAPLRPALAAAMLRYGGYHAEHHLLDPMAGGGTLPVEAATIACHMPPDALRSSSYAFERLGFVEPLHLEELRVLIASEQHPETTGSIRAADLFFKNLKGLHLNVGAAGLQTHIQITRGNARLLDYLEEPAPNLIVTNPPFGLRIADPVEVRRLYLGFVQAAAAHHIPELVMLTPQRQFLRNAFEAAGYRELEHRHIHYGKLETGLFRARLEMQG